MFPDYETIALMEQGRIERTAFFKQVENDIAKAFIVEASLSRRLKSRSVTEVFMAKIVVARMIARSITSLIALRIHPVDFITSEQITFDTISKMLFFVTNDRAAMNMAFKEYFVERPSHMSNHKDWMRTFRYVQDTWANWLERFSKLPETHSVLLLSRIPQTTPKFTWFRLWNRIILKWYQFRDWIGWKVSRKSSNFKTL
jgi:hypothetical protein